MKGDRILLIGKGFNGWHASGLSGGNRFSSTNGSLEDYVSRANEGTPVYDASETDFETFAHIVISGPMVSHTVGESKKGGEYTALSYISVDSYIALLRAKLPGVKIGYVTVAGCVRWEGV